MFARTSRLALVALLPLTAPAVSLAHSDAAMDACVQAFLSSDVVKDRSVTVKKDSASVPRPLSGLYKIEVVAKERSGKKLARVECQADSNGTIVSLNGNPTSAVESVAATR